MATIISISGPSSSGKTNIINYMKMHQKFPRNPRTPIIFEPDIFKTVWDDLVDNGLFQKYDDITRDPEFLCIFTKKVANYYKSVIKKYKNVDATVIIEGCWVDLFIYAQVNMWCNNFLKDLQTSILKDIIGESGDISRVFITRDDESLRTVEKYHSPFRKYNVKYDRDLELIYYDFYEKFEDVEKLPSSDLFECVDYIVSEIF